MKAIDVRKSLKDIANPVKAEVLQGFFKTGKGQYGEGDIFLGITVPQQRKISKEFREIPLSELAKLLNSKIHEERLTSLLILVLKYNKAKGIEKKELVDFYLEHLRFVNNWDLVDSSAQFILGDWLLKNDRAIL